MKSAIETLRINLGILETNEPIHRAEGNTAQADLEAANAAEFRQAINLLEMANQAIDNKEDLHLGFRDVQAIGPIDTGSTAYHLRVVRFHQNQINAALAEIEKLSL